METMTPKEIVEKLDKYIVGQSSAKKAVAIALRNRYRRMKLESGIQEEIAPKNILMIGSTGVGKTEIARRMAKLTNSPFIKVEATKFTEVGYVGREVESIIKDLVEVAVALERKEESKEVEELAKANTVERLVSALIPGSSYDGVGSETREKYKNKLLRGELEDKVLEIQVSRSKGYFELLTPKGFEDITSGLQDMMKNSMSNKKEPVKMKISDARPIIFNEELDKLIDDSKIKKTGVERAENQGIVFIDEMDKICSTENNSGNVSREGVQRDLLPIVEGSTVSTKYGSVKTDHILFIAAGAFNVSKPSDLLPELQGRFPIRVELKSLTKDDFIKILKEPECSLINQYEALLGVDNIKVSFTEDSIETLANLTEVVNTNVEDIGARRLHTLLEKLLEEELF